MLRVGVLASGSGTNFLALAEACRHGRVPAEIAVLVVNVPGAGAIARAQSLGVPVELVDHRGFDSREAFEREVVTALGRHRVELVCLAGFMRLLSPVLLSAYEGRMINVHPSLLPAFPGMHAVHQALAYGARVSGCTVHFVDAGTDTGPILIQAAVPVLPGDDEASLARRIQVQEHRIYPEAVRLIALGKVHLEGRRVRVDGARADAGAALVSPGPGERDA